MKLSIETKDENKIKSSWLEENMNSIVHGDSYELIKKIPDNSIDCIYTDIPYEYGGGGEGTSILAKRITKTNYVDLKDIRDGIDFSILDEFVRVMKNINCFIWCSKLQILDIMNYFAKYDCTAQILVWCKTNPTPMCNGNWLPDLEYCLYFNRGTKLNDGYNLKSKYYVSPINKADKELYKHPTIKPMPLVKRHLQHVMPKGGIAFDPFSGSGTTCSCAKELGLNFLGIELVQEYHKISIDRINGITAGGQTSIFTDFDKLEGNK